MITKKAVLCICLFMIWMHSHARERFVYKHNEDRDLYMTLLRPAGWAATDERPALIFFYNGGWKEPGATKPQFEEQAQYFVARGLVVAQADYREKSADGVTSGKCVADIFSAVRWLRIHANELGIDPQRIAAAGGSGSIHLPAAVFQVDSVNTPGEDSSIDPLPGALFCFHPDPDVLDQSMMQRLLKGGDPPSERKMPPTIMYWGSRDVLAPFLEEFVKNAVAAGLPVTSHVHDGGVHGFYKFSPGLESTTKHMDDILSSIGYLSGTPEAELPHKNAPPGYEERILEMQQQWLERHNTLASERALIKKEPVDPNALSTQPEIVEQTKEFAPSRNWDTDNDGQLSEAEFKAPLQLFRNMDLDGNGFLAGNEVLKLDSKLDLAKTAETTWIAVPEETYHGITHRTYFSNSMQTEVGYNIYLPDSYYEAGKRFPVIYHLHGAGGNESSQIDLGPVYQKAIHEGKMAPVIIVFVNGGKRSYYSNNAAAGILAETTIIHELIPHIDAAYRTIPEKNCRVIHGFSMGGFGALKLGMKYPELFCAVLSFGGGMAAPDSIHMLFLKHIVGEDEQSIKANNPADIAMRNKQALSDLTLWLFTGTRDVAREDSLWAHQFLTDNNIPHRFENSEDVGHALKRHYILFGDEIFEMLTKHFETSPAFASHE